MKNILFIFSLLILIVTSLMAQDARFYYEGLYYNGPYVDLKIGETKYVTTDGDECCVDIINSNAAIKATAYEKFDYPPGWHPVNFFFYTETDFPEVFGTDQYEHVRIKVECMTKANTYKELPQPEIFVPFDVDNIHPNSENDHYIMPFNAGHYMLVLRRAFIWENAEDVGGWHGPYADIKIGVYNPIVLEHTEEQLAKDYSLWQPFNLRPDGKVSELPGPIWSGYAPMGYPDPYDEWIDGPFGCIYSNIAVYDWGTNPTSNQSVGIIITESEFMGKSQFAITPFMEGLILVKVWGFGWVVLENIWVSASGKEPSAAQGDVYWYGGWDGLYPVDVYGPTNPAVPNQNSFGSQFKPFTDELFWNFHNNSTFDGYTVGLLGDDFAILDGILDQPRIYTVSDKDKPAILRKK